MVFKSECLILIQFQDQIFMCKFIKKKISRVYYKITCDPNEVKIILEQKKIPNFFN